MAKASYAGGEGAMAPLELSVEEGEPGEAEWLDDDGRPRRTGTVWTASAHIITAVIGSGVLSLAWAIAQLGWAAGPAVILLFAFVTYYTSTLLAECYCSGNPATGNRNYTYMDAVRVNLGGAKVRLCGVIWYVNLFGVAIGYTIAASNSMMAIKRSDCFHKKEHQNLCHSSSNPYMIIFGVVQIVFSQIVLEFDQIWWLSIVTAVMSFTYSTIGLSLGIVQTVHNRGFQGSLTGLSISAGVTSEQKVWRSLRAVGDIAFAYSSIILIDMQDTIKAPPPSEAKVVKKAMVVSVAATTVFYMLCGCMGYAAFGDKAPDNLLTGFGFYEPFWLLDIANAAIVVHRVGAYQVFCQQLFAFVEKWAGATWPDSCFISREVKVGPFALSVFRLIWRTAFVCLTTFISMLLPFFGKVVVLLGIVSFWPLTVYFPVQMYIVQRGVRRRSTRWLCLQILTAACLVVSVAAAASSITDVIDALKVYRPFSG